MSSAPSVAIVGGGTIGLAAAWALARRGAKVQLFERHGHVHAHGSHGGYTRLIRYAYHEGSDYVDLVRRADREWTQLGARVGEALLVRCGLLEIGPEDEPEFRAARAALVDNDIRYEELDAADASRRYGFVIPKPWLATLSPDCGYLRVVPCLDALRREAEAAGARLHHHAPARELILGGDRPRVLLEDGRVIAADRVVVAAGAGSKALLDSTFASTPRPLTIQRRVLAWTRASEAARARLRALPGWAVFAPEGFFYGFPDNDEGISGFKLACHASADPALAFMNDGVDPEAVEREVGERDLRPLREFLARYRPDAGEIVESTTCLYTNTPSGDFWIEPHAADPRLVIAAGFSGHGFKFAPAVGVAVAELIFDGASELALARFRSRAADG